MKDQALWLYRNWTRRQRAALLAELRESARMPVAVLFYHRVADTHPNDWTMSCRDFAQQLDWLQQDFDVVSLSEAQRRMTTEPTDRPTVAITFDDGYQDNAEFAIPELARRGLTATYFVSTDFVAKGEPFPHDVAAGVPLAPNTIAELQEFRDLGIEIGAHTRSHCDLGKVTDAGVARDEILGSIEQLEAWLSEPVRYFAFPYGLPENTSQLAADILTQETNLKGFCTAYGAWNWPNERGTQCRNQHGGSEHASPRMHMRRIHADPGIERLKNWLTLDRRKLQDKAVLPFVDRPAARDAIGSCTNDTFVGVSCAEQISMTECH